MGMLGALAGVMGGLLLAPQSGKKTRADIARIANDIYKQLRLGVVETERKIIEIYGEATKQAKDSFSEIKMAVSERLAAVKETGEAIDKDKYGATVDKVVTEYKKDFENTKNGAEKMIDYLKKDWEKVKKALTLPEKASLKPGAKSRQ